MTPSRANQKLSWLDVDLLHTKLRQHRAQFTCALAAAVQRYRTPAALSRDKSVIYDGRMLNHDSDEIHVLHLRRVNILGVEQSSGLALSIGFCRDKKHMERLGEVIG